MEATLQLDLKVKFRKRPKETKVNKYKYVCKSDDHSWGIELHIEDGGHIDFGLGGQYTIKGADKIINGPNILKDILFFDFNSIKSSNGSVSKDFLEDFDAYCVDHQDSIIPLSVILDLSSFELKTEKSDPLHTPSINITMSLDIGHTLASIYLRDWTNQVNGHIFELKKQNPECDLEMQSLYTNIMSSPQKVILNTF